eukprot:2211008-Amphidinium_carterae.1
MILDGSLTTPVLCKLAFVVQQASKANSRVERQYLDSCLNHVAGLLKMQVNQQTRNHIVGSIFEVRMLRLLQEGSISPEVLGAKWSPYLRPALQDAVCLTYFAGRRNTALENQIEASSTDTILCPFVAKEFNLAGNFSAEVDAQGDPKSAKFKPASSDLDDKVMHKILTLVQGCGSAVNAPGKVGHSLSWLTPKVLENLNRLILAQAWMCINSTTPESQLDEKNTWFFDGSVLRRPSATELRSSWVGTIRALKSPNHVLADIAGSPPLQGAFASDADLTTWCNLPVKTGAYAATPPPGSAATVTFTSGQVYAQ